MLEIFLLGGIIVQSNGERITRFQTQKEIALFAYLAHTGKTTSREALADLLWEARSTKQSLSNLRTTLTRLRKQVGEQLIVTRKVVSVIPVVHEQTDTTRMQALLAGAGKERPAAGATLLAQGLDLYNGEFMAGFYLPEAPRFNDWLAVERERLLQIAIRGFRQLAAWQEKHSAAGAGVLTAQRWVSCDPFDETAQQQLMRLLVMDGRVAEALQAYEKCRLLLEAELAVPPEPATTALYQAIQDGSLAPPDIVPAPLHNLPRILTPLYGRSAEIQRLTAIVINPDYPLISITGAGGMGKTSLALAAGRHLLAAEEHPFPDGIWFVSLEALENDTPQNIRALAASLIGLAMDLYFQTQSDLWAQLLGQLASKKLLLILDNIEQILPTASDLIVDLLRAGEGIQLLVTSRTNLALAASVTFPLAGLETPNLDSDMALKNESVRLFAERAARMPANFDLQKHLPQVVAICQFVEGMPLAIELAAASLGRLMVDEILPALTGSLHLLNSTQRDLPARQRTMQAVFEASWQMLDPREQSLLAQISIFRGGFSRQAAESIINESSSGLYILQHHALLKRDESGRFRMHPLLRQLAGEKLNAPPLIAFAGPARQSHSLYFSEFIGSFAAELQRGIGQEALQTILPEQANLRAAWEYAVGTGEWAIIAACLDGSHYFYQRKGFFSEEAALIDGAINRLQETMDEQNVVLTALLSRLLTVRARDHLHAAQFDEGLQTAERACELASLLQNQGPSTALRAGPSEALRAGPSEALRAGLEGQARLVSAQILSTQQKRKEALVEFEQVAALAKSAHNQILEADGLIGMGEQLGWIGNIQETQETLHTALELCQTVQYKPGEMRTLILLGELALRQGAFELTASYDRQAYQLSRLLGDVGAEAKSLGSLGVGLTSLYDLTGSQSAHEEALALFRRLHMPESVAWILGQLGYTAIQLGDYDKAQKRLAEALGIAIQLEDLFWQGWVKLRLGSLAIEQGEPDKALSYITEALQTAEHFQYLNFRSAVLYEWGNLLLSQGDWANAADKFQEAYDYRQGAGRIENATPSLACLAYATYRQGLRETAAGHAEQLWQTWQESPDMAERADLILYWRLGIVWDGLEDERAHDLWQKARDLLHRRIETIPDERARKLFLEQVPAHRALLKVPI
jgi:DNA-binding SARP family transcriptional activator/predicted ATPase